ncbi:MAG TPA: TetR family transcriptional regulator [Streptosporangiaceae bacterium]|nr:TetR family transcriptional regulator [Streptosporangiaceae bacterium]
MSRTGRRPGTPDTRDAILAAARRAFATRGYDATSLRGIATEANVDPALVIHYFGTKEGLFVAATGLPAGLSEAFGNLAELPVHDFAYVLVRSYLELVDSDKSRNAILALVRSAVSNDKAAAMLREFLAAGLLPAIAGRIGHPDAQLRASLVAAQLIGIATQRHVIGVEPLVKASPDEIATLVAPAIEQYLR